jgi:hypothetical protein
MSSKVEEVPTPQKTEEQPKAKPAMSSMSLFAIGGLVMLLVVILIAIFAIQRERKKFENKSKEYTLALAERDEALLKLEEHSSAISDLRKQLNAARAIAAVKPKEMFTNAGMTIPKVSAPEHIQMSDESQPRGQQMSDKRKIQQMVNQTRTTNEELMKQDETLQQQLDEESISAVKSFVSQPPKVETVPSSDDDDDDDDLPIVDNIVGSNL